MVKKENGNGVNYASYLVAIILVAVLFSFLVYYQKLIVVREELLNGLQMSESYILSAGKYDTEDITIERELKRAHIVTEYTVGTNKTRAENIQIRELSNLFIKQIKQHFSLDTQNIPRGNTLEELAAGRVLIDFLTIYEAVYNEAGDITQFIAYTVHFTNNSYSSIYEKQLLPADTTVTLNGRERELKGSSVFAKLDYSIFGPNYLNLFETKDNDIFHISVESGVDVVLTDKDDEQVVVP